jgi:hypothetical protein
VLISVIFPGSGSYIESWRLERSSGNIFADGCSEPFLQKAGFSAERTREVNQTRPFSSNMGLCILVLLSQMTSSPQYGDGAMALSLEDGVFGSIRRSSALLRETWGEQIVSGFGQTSPS